MPAKISSTSKHHPLHSSRRALSLPINAQRFLAVFEGLEGGFAIGASIVVALTFAGLDRSVLLTTVIITLIVSGFNTASVKYSSEHFLDELDGREKKSAFKHYFIPSLIEFISYLTISFVTILPLIFIVDTTTAVAWCAITTLAILYGAGYWRAYILRMPAGRDALETLLLGVGILAVGLVSGYVIHYTL